MAQPDESHPDLRLDPILAVLDRHKVEYLLVGGKDRDALPELYRLSAARDRR